MHLIPTGRSDIVELLVSSGLAIDAKDSNGNSGLMLAVVRGEVERVRTYLNSGADVDASEPIPTHIKIEGETKLPPLLVAIHQRKIAVLQVLVDHGADLRPKFSSRYGRTALLYAAANHMHEAVQCLVLAKVDIKVQNKEGGTALHEVATAGNDPYSYMLLHLLLSAGANIEAQDRYGFTALHAAAQEGALAIVDGLLDAGADVEARSGNLKTPLHLAAGHGQVEVVQRLLKKGAAVHKRDYKSDTALHIACRKRCDKNLRVIKYLLGPRGASVLEAGDCGRLPPHQAALSGFKEAVELFLAGGFDKGLPDAQGLQMIHHAISHGHLDLLKLLFERGAVTSCGNRTQPGRPLHFAARGGHDEAVSVLHKYGAEIDELDDKGKTALFHAVHEGRVSTVSLLCDLGAAINKRGRNVVVEAASQGNARIVSILCGRKANIQIDTHTGDAPLLEAVTKGHVEVVRILLEHGAVVEVRSKKQYWTPLHIAAHNNHKEVVKLLLKKGADRKAVTKDGKTAWALADRMGHLEVYTYLGKPPIQPKLNASGEASSSANCKKIAVVGKKSSRR